MLRKTLTVDIEYKEFEVGELVRPSSRRHELPDGIYTVTDCRPPIPRCWDGITTVFVEGHRYGVDAKYLLPASDPCFICDGCQLPLPLGDVGACECSRCTSRKIKEGR